MNTHLRAAQESPSPSPSPLVFQSTKPCLPMISSSWTWSVLDVPVSPSLPMRATALVPRLWLTTRCHTSALVAAQPHSEVLGRGRRLCRQNSREGRRGCEGRALIVSVASRLNPPTCPCPTAASPRRALVHLRPSTRVGSEAPDCQQCSRRRRYLCYLQSGAEDQAAAQAAPRETCPEWRPARSRGYCRLALATAHQEPCLGHGATGFHRLRCVWHN